MLNDIVRLTAAITEDASTGKNTDVRILALLAMEVRARLALEKALETYLEKAPANPFAASATLLEFLRNDETKESLGA